MVGQPFSSGPHIPEYVASRNRLDGFMKKTHVRVGRGGRMGLWDAGGGVAMT